MSAAKISFPLRASVWPPFDEMKKANPSKAELRQQMRDLLAKLRADPAVHAQRSAKICSAIREHAAWKNAQTVCAFLPMRAEPQIQELWKSDPGARRFCFPRGGGGALELVRIDEPAVLERATWKMDLPEISNAQTVSLAEVDLILVPGVAFSRDGWRLGRGGGFYDRLLAGRSTETTALGICFEVQIAKALPLEEHDLKVDAVVTESGAA